MKRIALFAHYDCDGLIDDYVIYYLRGLSRVADRVLFVSDSELIEGEAAKLEGYADLVFAGRHGEYDFGSWKRGLEFLNYDLCGFDELIIANDSCYAPIYPFEQVFERMQAEVCDFWSPSANTIKKRFDHMSSYFLVFRRPVLDDEAFLSFWKQIEPQPNAAAVIEKYERGLSRFLAGRGYTYGSLLPMAEIGSFLRTNYVHEGLHSYRSSWLKVRLLRDNPQRAIKLGDAVARIERLYPRALIDAHIMRLLGTTVPAHYNYRFIGSYERAFGPFRVTSRIKLNKKNPEAASIWKLYLKLFHVPFFMFFWPVRV